MSQSAAPDIPRRVLVTGAASGIGRATAARFLAAGALVAGIDRNAAGMPSGGVAPAVFADVAVEQEVEDAVTAAAEALGGLDVVVCAAGVTSRGSVAGLAVSEWDRVFAINVRGVFLTCRAAIPFLRRSDAAAIVTVASQLGLVAGRSAAAYCASKGAVLSLTRAMAVDHAVDAITVNAVCPGPTDTPMSDAHFDGPNDPQRAEVFGMTLTGRFVTPEEVAAAIDHLASREARSTTGAALVVDGGYVVR